MNNALKLFDDRTFMEPLSSMSLLQKSIDQLFDDVWSPTVSSWRSVTAQAAPACDVEETDSHYLFSMDLPGVSKNDIRVETQGNHLKISAERKADHRSNEKAYRSLERAFGRWERQFALPDAIQADRIEASYQDGVLHVAIPKAESAKPRQIKIQEGRGGFFSKLLGQNDPKKAEVEVKSE